MKSFSAQLIAALMFKGVAWHCFVFVKACNCLCLCKTCTSQLIRKRCHWYFTFTKQTLWKLHLPTLSSKPWLPILSFGALLKFGTNVLGDGCTCMWNILMTVLVCAPVYARSENRALDAFLYYFLPWHRSHTGKLTFDLGCLVEATWRSASLWPHITGVTCTYFAILFMWVWRSELRSSCPHVCRTSLPTMEPFPQSCLVDFHTGTFATTFILTCVSSLFSFMLGLCFR